MDSKIVYIELPKTIHLWLISQSQSQRVPLKNVIMKAIESYKLNYDKENYVNDFKKFVNEYSDTELVYDKEFLDENTKNILNNTDEN